MTWPTGEGLVVIDEASRVQLVRAALRRDDAEPTSWNESELFGAGAAERYRVGGQALVDGEHVDWSLVVKVMHPGDGRLGQPPDIETSSRSYWKREWLTYHAAWLTGAIGMAVPRVLGAVEATDSLAWLAMEDLAAFDARPWSITQFADVARQCGEFNGYFAAGRRPTEAWLSTGWLRGWADIGQPMSALLDAATDLPVGRAVFSESIVRGMRWLWDSRSDLFAALDERPQTMCHYDLHPRNAFLRPTQGGEQVVVIDWSECGSGPVGADLAGFIGSSIFLAEVEPRAAAQVEAGCFENYLRGLTSAGWRGDDADVRFAYLATLLLRFTIGFVGPVLSVATDESNAAWAEQVLGRPVSEFLDTYKFLMEFAEPRIDELRLLIDA